MRNETIVFLGLGLIFMCIVAALAWQGIELFRARASAVLAQKEAALNADQIDYMITELKRIGDVLRPSHANSQNDADIAEVWRAEQATHAPGSPKYKAFDKRLREIGAI